MTSIAIGVFFGLVFIASIVGMGLFEIANAIRQRDAEGKQKCKDKEATWSVKSSPPQVISALEIDASDWSEFCQAREVIRRLLKKNLSEQWGFVHTVKRPKVYWENCEIVKK